MLSLVTRSSKGFYSEGVLEPSPSNGLDMLTEASHLIPTDAFLGKITRSRYRECAGEF